MFYVNLGATNDKVSCYVMLKHLIIDVDTLAKKFKIDSSPPKLMARSFLSIKMNWLLKCCFPMKPLGKS